MKFAVNYSKVLDRLIRKKDLKIDLLKCPEWEGVVNAALKLRPVHIHFEIAVGNNSLKNLDFDLIRTFLQKTDTPHLNCHLAGNKGLAINQHGNRETLLKTWISEMQFLKEKLPGYELVAEILPFKPNLPEYFLASSPDLVKQAILEADAHLLLDLSHVQISADSLGMGSKEYIEKLPVERIREIHVTGIKDYGGSLDDHFEMSAQDWKFAEWAARRLHQGDWCLPEIIAFEYGGVGDVFGWRTEEWVLEEQVPRLYDLFKA